MVLHGVAEGLGLVEQRLELREPLRGREAEVLEEQGDVDAELHRPVPVRPKAWKRPA